ncbi:MAG: caspase family protein [Thainema sp.]
MKRRHFLQFSGAAFACLGLSQLRLVQTGQHLNHVLAQSAPRKLALLVGVNEYLGNVRSLYGCVTDVALQRELLLHRYGFQPDDVMTLTDETALQPTRANILQAFEEHLINQAQPGDVVLFHYSGHGSLVQDATIPEFNGLDGTIVPRDGRINLNGRQVQDITGKTLFLLMSALQTENVTVILDSCHSGGGTRGNLVVRAISPSLSSGDALPSDAEVAYQQQWMTRLGLSESELQERRRAGIAKGMALGSAQIDQFAADARFDGFSAGAFTYHLTQYLWQQPTVRPAQVTFNQLVFATQNMTNIVQNPVLQVKPGSGLESKPLYLLEPVAPAAEAVVQQHSGNQVDFWLGGISSSSLVNFRQGAVFELINAAGQVVGEVEQVGRSGLVGQGRIRTTRGSAIQPGMLLREHIRGLPTNLSLRVGLHESLGADQAEVRSHLQSISRIHVVPVNQQSSTDYLLGRMTEATARDARQASTSSPPAIGTIGLFSSGMVPLPGSFGQPNEAMSDAIARLRPRFKMLLAGRILASVNNGSASNLNVEVTVQPHSSRGGLQLASRGAQVADILPTSVTEDAQRVLNGSTVELQITNHEATDLYVSVLLIAKNGDILLLHPLNWDEATTAAQLRAGQPMVIPDPEQFEFVARSRGFYELLVLASTQPLHDTLRGLQRIAGNRGLRTGQPILFDEDEPVEIVDSMLTDASRGIGVVPFDSSTATSEASDSASSAGTVRGIDSNQLAVISATLEVV